MVVVAPTHAQRGRRRERLQERAAGHDGTSVTRRSFSGCHGDADVVAYEIQGGGHRWLPQQARSAMETVAGRAFGVSSQNIDATAVIWDFFSAHARR